MTATGGSDGGGQRRSGGGGGLGACGRGRGCGLPWKLVCSLGQPCPCIYRRILDESY